MLNWSDPMVTSGEDLATLYLVPGQQVLELWLPSGGSIGVDVELIIHLSLIDKVD